MKSPDCIFFVRVLTIKLGYYCFVNQLYFVNDVKVERKFRIGDLVEAGSLSLSEFVNGLVIRSFAQQVENLEIGISSETSSNTENLVNKFSISMLHKRNATGKRKRSQSPIGISGSFGPGSK